MTSRDIGAGMRLKEIAGWNQTAADWRVWLDLEPDGCFVAEREGYVVATTTAVNYENRFGWIGMVIVDPAVRRQGIATRMIRHAVEYLKSRSCLCQKLDATEEGARVYEKLGFKVEYEVQRWWRDPTARQPAEAEGNVKPLSVSDLDLVLDLDRPAFGASRRELLRWYCSNSSPRFAVRSRAELKAYVVGREGSRAWQIGPLISREARLADGLIGAFLRVVGGEPVIVDIVAGNDRAVELLQTYGFVRQRVLYRMFRSQNAWPGEPEQMFALAGFEYG